MEIVEIVWNGLLWVAKLPDGRRIAHQDYSSVEHDVLLWNYQPRKREINFDNTDFYAQKLDYSYNISNHLAKEFIEKNFNEWKFINGECKGIDEQAILRFRFRFRLNSSMIEFLDTEHWNLCKDGYFKKVTDNSDDIYYVDSREVAKELCDKYEEEHNTTFKLWTTQMEEMPDYEEKMKLKQENQKLVKVIEELEKWLKERINRYEYSTGNMNMAAAGTLKATLNKLTELKGGDKDEI